MNGKILLTMALVWPVLLALNNKLTQDDRKMIQGTWVVIEAELRGQKLPDEAIKGTKLILTNGRYEYQNDRGEYTLSPADEIKAMDIVGLEGPNKGKTFLAIYALEADKLKICYDLAGNTRPTKFKTEAGTRQFLVTYQREKGEPQEMRNLVTFKDPGDGKTELIVTE
jgi:uncharacterized protein (TIGR03067 family)